MDYKAIRRQLHKHPENSGDEKNTARKITELLQEIGLDEIHNNFSQHSVLGIINGSEKGKSILVRCELDALPIAEANTFEHRSQNKGVSHKCGHDGHMAIMIALADKLVKHTPSKGTFLLLFQSAEETGEGARKIIESGFMDSFSIDHALSLHNVPGYEKHKIICRKNEFTPSVESFELKLTGETSHAGEPDKGKNPAQCIAQVINYMQSLHQPDVNASDYFVVAPIHIEMGSKAYGTSAGQSNIGYTIRSIEQDYFEKRKKMIEKDIKQMAESHALGFELEWKEGFNSNKNDSVVVDAIRQTSKELNLDYLNKDAPFDWGEDFGLFTQKYSGAMFGLGSGEDTPPLHDAYYDFPDEIIQTGRDMFYELVTKLQ